MPIPALPTFRRVGAHPQQGGVAAFRFELPASAVVTLEVFDAAGRRIATILRGERQAGSHLVPWSGRADGARVPAGVYFVRFSTAGYAATEKVVLVR